MNKKKKKNIHKICFFLPAIMDVIHDLKLSIHDAIEAMKSVKF